MIARSYIRNWGVTLAGLGLCLGAALAAPPDAERMARGKQVFIRWCHQCHGPGDQMPGTLALEAKYKGSVPAVLEERDNLHPDMTKYFVRYGVSIMPFFRKTEISDAQLEDLAAYLDKKAK